MLMFDYMHDVRKKDNKKSLGGTKALIKFATLLKHKFHHRSTWLWEDLGRKLYEHS